MDAALDISIEEAEKQQHVAESLLAARQAQLKLEALDSIEESFMPRRVPPEEYPWYDPNFSDYAGRFVPSFPFTTRQDRTDGRYRPFYENEYDLRSLRSKSRLLSAFSEMVRGAIDVLGHYTIGEGPTFTVNPVDEDDAESKALASKIQRFVDRFIEDNDFNGTLDREIHNRSREDGEAPVALYEDNGKIRAIIIEPDYICEPASSRVLEDFLGVGHKLNYWWHGVHTQFNPVLRTEDRWNPVGYYVQWDDASGEWDYLDSMRVELFKRNVPMDAWRGVTDLMPILEDLQREEKIRRNTSEGAAIQAAIALIRKAAPGTPASSIQSSVSSAAHYTRRQSTDEGTKTIQRQHFAPGTIVNSPSGQQFEAGPMGSLNQPVFIEVAQYLRRSMAVRWVMPEYMISSDASNSNFASTLVAESPFVKAREAEQQQYIRGFRTLIWKAVFMAYQSGRFGRAMPFEYIRDIVDIKCDLPDVASRDRMQQAQVGEIHQRMGIVSDQTLATEAGYDYEDEVAMGAKRQEQPMAPAGFGESTLREMWESYP